MPSVFSYVGLKNLEEINRIKLSKSVRLAIRQLVYYNIFNYPLNRQELFLEEQPLNEIFALVREGVLHQQKDLFSISSNKRNFQNRIEGNQLCTAQTPKANKRAMLIYQFPFVRGVYISGSMSKGFMTPGGDVDYFIITKPGKLWLTRTILIFFKKVFLGNSRKFFCLNYFVDTDHLEIEEKNIFTATELVTLIPVCVDQTDANFKKANNWVFDYYPNANFKKAALQPTKSGFLKRFLEFVLNNKIADKLDEFFMTITLKVWERKFENYQPDDFSLALKTRKYVSKHHPQNFQKKVLTQYQADIQKFEQETGVDLSI